MGVLRQVSWVVGMVAMLGVENAATAQSIYAVGFTASVNAARMLLATAILVGIGLASWFKRLAPAVRPAVRDSAGVALVVLCVVWGVCFGIQGDRFRLDAFQGIGLADDAPADELIGPSSGTEGGWPARLMLTCLVLIMPITTFFGVIGLEAIRDHGATTKPNPEHVAAEKSVQDYQLEVGRLQGLLAESHADVDEVNDRAARQAEAERVARNLEAAHKKTLERAAAEAAAREKDLRDKAAVEKAALEEEVEQAAHEKAELQKQLDEQKKALEKAAVEKAALDKARHDTEAARDAHGNLAGSDKDLVPDGGMLGRKILVAALGHEEIGLIDDSPLVEALTTKGFAVERVKGPFPSLAEFERTLDGANQLWVWSSPENGRLRNAHLQAIAKRWRAGTLALCLLADNTPFTCEAAAVLNAIAPGSVIQGNYHAEQTLHARSGRGGGFDPKWPGFHNVDRLFEGITVSTVTGPGLVPVCWASNGAPLIATLEREGSSRALVHCGFTSFFRTYWDDAGIRRVAMNAAGWLGGAEAKNAE